MGGSSHVGAIHPPAHFRHSVGVPASYRRSRGHRNKDILRNPKGQGRQYDSIHGSGALG